MRNVINPGFYCQREIEMNPVCEEQCDHCKVYYAPLHVELRLEQLKKLKVGKKVVAKAERETAYLAPYEQVHGEKNPVELLHTPELVPQEILEGEIIKGEVIEINYETGDVTILTPDGFEKTVNILNFLITIVPLIKQLVIFIRDLWRELKNS